jgi:hypothetical protein
VFIEVEQHYIDGKESPEAEVLGLTLSEFIERFRVVLRKFCAHQCEVYKQYIANDQLTMNLLPHQLRANFDFSQNMKINHTKYETQSLNWLTRSVTLFVGVVEFLDYRVWTTELKSLKSGDKVGDYQLDLCLLNNDRD